LKSAPSEQCFCLAIIFTNFYNKISIYILYFYLFDVYYYQNRFKL